MKSWTFCDIYLAAAKAEEPKAEAPKAEGVKPTAQAPKAEAPKAAAAPSKATPPPQAKPVSATRSQHRVCVSASLHFEFFATVVVIQHNVEWSFGYWQHHLSGMIIVPWSNIAHLEFCLQHLIIIHSIIDSIWVEWSFAINSMRHWEWVIIRLLIECNMLRAINWVLF